jgi:FtsP/CotA-like multicopper oxidase with cupredoxin domain
VGSVVGLVVLVAVVAVGWIGLLWWESRLPDTYSVLDHGTVDLGGGTDHGQHASPGQTVSVADLHGPREGTPDARFTLTAQHATIELASGRPVEALTFNGRSPGPELRVRQGDLVEVTLENEDVEPGVTIHWHGVDVPNAEDGVAGVTQDAVLPGERYVYRFRAEQVGTFWYHTHQVSSTEVRRGLLGTLVTEPRGPSEFGLDRTVVAHTYDGIPTLDGDEGSQLLDVEPGTQVRLRLVNTDDAVRRFALAGTPFRVLAIDGADLNEPGEIRDVQLAVAAGGRMDLGFTVPSSPVWLALLESNAGLVINDDAPGDTSTFVGLSTFDPLSYGRPAETALGAESAFDRRFELRITRKLGFFDGRPGRQWALNDGIFPDVPVFHVDEGDLVEVTIENDSDTDHPMHLHGHHALVLGRNGEPASGSPWSPDTLNVEPGESYRVAFRADNPGIWMDHCHNLSHAADGLTMHVAYAGVTTPFDIGGEHRNEPE